MNNPETEKAVEDMYSLSLDALRDGACWKCLARAMAEMACGIIEHYSGEDAVTAFLEERLEFVRSGKSPSSPPTK